MRAPSLITNPVLWLGSLSVAAAIGFACGCSSSSPGPETSTGEDSGTKSDGGTTSDTGTGGDAMNMQDVVGDGAHDGAAPDALYSACALNGSFGWPCTLTATGPDPTDCTDPNYPDCFVGGQGAWCTKACTMGTDCTTGLEDAGCVPTACNARGYCK
jgi:hypothetical protein